LQEKTRGGEKAREREREREGEDGERKNGRLSVSIDLSW